jgi:hypothetical protein
MQHFFTTRALVTQRTSSVLMYLHDVTSAVCVASEGSQTLSSVTLDSSSLEEVRVAVQRLIKIIDIPSDFISEFKIDKNEWICDKDSQITYGIRNRGYCLEESLLNTEEIVEFVQEWTRRSQQNLLVDENTSFYKQIEHDERLLCLSEGLVRLADTPYFRVFCTAIYLMRKECEDRLHRQCPYDIIDIILHFYPDLLLQLHFVSLALNCHNLVDRSRFILPMHFGVELALTSGHAAIEVLQVVIKNLTNMFNSWHLRRDDITSFRLVDSALHYILKELEIILASLFANVLDISFHACLFDEGYIAVIRLAELCYQSTAREEFWSQRIVSLISAENDIDNVIIASDRPNIGASSLEWHGCLRSLVVKACSCGQLQWVCSLPRKDNLNEEVEKISILTLRYEDNGHVIAYEAIKIVDIIKEIVDQLEFACSSYDFMDYFSGMTNSNSDLNSLHLLALYDCFAAFLLSKGLRQDCARVLYQLVKRLDDEMERQVRESDDFNAIKILTHQAR